MSSVRVTELAGASSQLYIRFSLLEAGVEESMVTPTLSVNASTADWGEEELVIALPRGSARPPLLALALWRDIEDEEEDAGQGSGSKAGTHPDDDDDDDDDDDNGGGGGGGGGGDEALAFEDVRLSDDYKDGGDHAVKMVGRKGSGYKHVTINFTSTVLE